MTLLQFRLVLAVRWVEQVLDHFSSSKVDENFVNHQGQDGHNVKGRLTHVQHVEQCERVVNQEDCCVH